MKWIKVSDKLPKIGEMVILFLPEKGHRLKSVESGSLYITRSTDMKRFRLTYRAVESKEVTHWMPMPKPPTEEEM